MVCDIKIGFNSNFVYIVCTNSTGFIFHMSCLCCVILCYYASLIVSKISLYKFKRLLTKIVKKTIDDLVFTEMIHDKMQQLEKLRGTRKTRSY